MLHVAWSVRAELSRFSSSHDRVPEMPVAGDDVTWVFGWKPMNANYLWIIISMPQCRSPCRAFVCCVGWYEVWPSFTAAVVTMFFMETEELFTTPDWAGYGFDIINFVFHGPSMHSCGCTSNKTVCFLAQKPTVTHGQLGNCTPVVPRTRLLVWDWSISTAAAVHMARCQRYLARSTRDQAAGMVGEDQQGSTGNVQAAVTTWLPMWFAKRLVSTDFLRYILRYERQLSTDFLVYT